MSHSFSKAEKPSHAPMLSQTRVFFIRERTVFLCNDSWLLGRIIFGRLLPMIQKQFIVTGEK